MKKRIDPGYLISLLLSVVLAFVIGAVILAIAGFSPGKAYLAMLNGAFSSARHIGDLLEYAMVLCLCGLACVLGARVGIFNVGGEGQLLLGAIAACQVGVWLDGLTPWLVLPLAALAAIAGVLLCSTVPTLQPTTGSMPGIRAFTAAVFGGIGSIPGAMLGGILLGIIETFSKAYLSPQFSDAIVFAVLIVILLVKPAGLLGKQVQEKV